MFTVKGIPGNLDKLNKGKFHHEGHGICGIAS